MLSAGPYLPELDVAEAVALVTLATLPLLRRLKVDEILFELRLLMQNSKRLDTFDRNFSNERVFQIDDEELLFRFKVFEISLDLSNLAEQIEPLNLPHLGSEVLLAPRSGRFRRLLELLNQGFARLAQNVLLI